MGKFDKNNVEYKNNLISNISNTSHEQSQGLIDQENIYFGYYYNEELIDPLYPEFLLCQYGQYLENGGETQCLKCLDNAECPGGYKNVYPKPKV